MNTSRIKLFLKPNSRYRYQTEAAIKGQKQKNLKFEFVQHFSVFLSRDKRIKVLIEWMLTYQDLARN